MLLPEITCQGSARKGSARTLLLEPLQPPAPYRFNIHREPLETGKDEKDESTTRRRSQRTGLCTRSASIESVTWSTPKSDAGRLPGAVTLVARRGKVVHSHVSGKLDVERPAPVAADSLFRLHSQTKPMTAAVLMALFEEGAFLLDEPVSKWIPEFAKPGVFALKPPQDAVRGDYSPTTPARREITIFDLLTMTSGLPSLGRTPVACIQPTMERRGNNTGRS